MSSSSSSQHTRYEIICHPLFLAVAAGLNLPPMVFGALGFAYWCEAFSRWFIGNACLSGINIIAALYSVYKIRRTAKLEMATDGQEGVENISNINNVVNNVNNDHPATALVGDNSDLIIDIDTEGVDIEKDEEDTDSNNASSSQSEDDDDDDGDDGGGGGGGSQQEIDDDDDEQHHQHDDDDDVDDVDVVENNNIINGVPTTTASSNGYGRRRSLAAAAAANDSSSSGGWGCCSRLIRLKTISSDRIRHLICYDGALVTYSILFFVWLVWLSDGTQQLNNIDSVPEEDLEGCDEIHERYMYLSLVCGFSYFAFVMLAVLFSLCRA